MSENYSAILDWRGPSQTVDYGTTTAYDLSATATTPSPQPFSSAGPFWEAKLTNLLPNTTYHYAIGNGADHTFHTARPSSSTSFTVDIQGDIGDTSSYPNMAIVQAMIAADRPDLVLAVGDLTYADAHGQSHVDKHFNDVQAWSLGSTAYMPAWGNHEWDSSGDNLKNYKGRFDLPNPQTSPGSPSVSCCGEDWYWFDYGNVRFIAYPEPYSGAWLDWSARVKPLMDQAQANTNIRFIVTFGHRPAYSSGHHAGDKTLKSYMDALGATHSKYVLNLNGHSHNYERTSPQSNVVHITAGVGGASLEQDGSCLWLVCSKPAWSARRYMHLGVTKLVFSSTGIQGSFICGPAGGGTNDVSCSQGEVLDSFTIGTPGAAPTPTVTPTSPSATPISTLTSTPLSTPTAPTPLSGCSDNPCTVVTTADTRVQEDFPTTSYGSSTTLSVVATGGAQRESYLRFNVSGVTTPILSARLRVFCTTDPTLIPPLVYTTDNTWSESGLTWNTRPARSGTGVSGPSTIAANSWAEYDVTALVTGDGTYNFVLAKDTSDSVMFSSSEGGTAAQLVLTMQSTGTPTASSTPTRTAVPTSTPTGTPTATRTAAPSPTETAGPDSGQEPLGGVTDSEAVFTVPQVQKPSYLTPTTDPTFGTIVTRIAGNTGTTFTTNRGTQTWQADARHHNAKDQPWSSDGSLIALHNDGASSPTVFLDGTTYKPKYSTCPNYSPDDDRWHPSPSHPHERINVNGTLLNWFDVTTCTETKRIPLPFSAHYLGMGQGNPSNDGRYLVLADSTDTHLYVVDMVANKVGPARTVTDCGLTSCALDWVSVSPSGKYAVAMYTGSHPRVYDLNSSTLGLTPRPMPTTSPTCSGQNLSLGFIFDLSAADMTLNPFNVNADVIVGQRRSTCPATVKGTALGQVVMVRLRDNTVKSLSDPTNEAYVRQISTRNTGRPGWAYVTYYTAPGKRFSNEVVAVKLDGSRAVQRFAHTHSSGTPYRNEEQAVPARDGARMLFASGWDQDCGTRCGTSNNPQAYVVDAGQQP